MKLIGEIYVDSGQIRIADPCYEDDTKGTLTVNTPLGDGIYHVFEMYDDEGNVIALTIDLDAYGLAVWHDKEDIE